MINVRESVRLHYRNMPKNTLKTGDSPGLLVFQCRVVCVYLLLKIFPIYWKGSGVDRGAFLGIGTQRVHNSEVVLENDESNQLAALPCVEKGLTTSMLVAFDICGSGDVQETKGTRCDND